MITIKKTSDSGDIQRFDVLETRTEMTGFINDTLEHATKDGVWTDHESFLWGFYRNGHCFDCGTCEIACLNIREIDSLICGNTGTTVLFGDFDIFLNERSGRWQASLEG